MFLIDRRSCFAAAQKIAMRRIAGRIRNFQH
jgi:hypothetical protein